MASRGDDAPGGASVRSRPKQALDYLIERVASGATRNPYLDAFVNDAPLLRAFQELPCFDRTWRRKANIAKEVTEAAGALAQIEARCLPPGASRGDGAGLAFVDLCAGRGMLAILVAHAFPRAAVVAVDADANVNLDHYAAFPNLAHHRVDVYADETERIVRDLVARSDACVVVGVHLCGDLSRRAVELWDAAGAAALVLAPCCLPRRRRCDAFGFHVRDQARRLKVDAHRLWCLHLFGLLPLEEDSDARCAMCVDDDVLGPRGTFLVARWNEDGNRTWARRWKRSGGERGKRGGGEGGEGGIVAGVGAGKWRVLR